MKSTEKEKKIRENTNCIKHRLFVFAKRVSRDSGIPQKLLEAENFSLVRGDVLTSKTVHSVVP
jgi:hypothetical protein